MRRCRGPPLSFFSRQIRSTLRDCSSVKSVALLRTRSALRNFTASYHFARSGQYVPMICCRRFTSTIQQFFTSADTALVHKDYVFLQRMGLCCALVQKDSYRSLVLQVIVSNWLY